MTGKSVLYQALSLLNYRNLEELSGQSEVLLNGMAAVNQIYADLHYACSNQPWQPLSDLSEHLLLPDRAAADVMPYGVAMLLAQSQSDGDNQQLFAELYSRKRSSLSHSDQVADRLPRAGL